jgi:hypothetical protein
MTIHYKIKYKIKLRFEKIENGNLFHLSVYGDSYRSVKYACTCRNGKIDTYSKGDIARLASDFFAYSNEEEKALVQGKLLSALFKGGDDPSSVISVLIDCIRLIAEQLSVNVSFF